LLISTASRFEFVFGFATRDIWVFNIRFSFRTNQAVICVLNPVHNFNLFYGILTSLKFGSEAWVLKKREEQSLEAAQMKFLRRLLGITKLDKEKNQCIGQETGAQNTVKEIKQYQKKWLQHVQRMDTDRLPKQALQYKPKGRRNIGRPRKRWRDQLHLEDQGTGNTPNPSGT